MKSPSAITVAPQMMPVPIVMRSRLRSATDEPPRPLDTPPPNMSESPPPRPLWSRIRRMRSRLVRTSSTVSARITVAQPNGGVARSRSGERSEIGHVVEAADPTELGGVQARAPDEAPVDVGLGHDAGDVRRLHRAAVLDADRLAGGFTPRLGDPAPESGADLLGVVGRRDLAGADRPDRFVGDDQATDLVGAETGEGAVELGERVLDLSAGLADLEPLADADDRG